MKKLLSIGLVLCAAIGSASAYYGAPRSYSSASPVYYDFSSYSYQPDPDYYAVTTPVYVVNPNSIKTHNKYSTKSYYLPFYESATIHTKKSVLTTVPAYSKIKDFHGYIASDRSKDYYTDETIRNVTAGDKVRFFVQRSSLNRSQGISWKWNYNSEGLHCSEKDNGQTLDCVVAKVKAADVWVEFFVPTTPGSRYGERVQSNRITVVPYEQTYQSKEKVYYDGYSSLYYY